MSAVTLFIYFLPTLTAWVKGKKDILAIALMNFLLGWTVICWFVLLIYGLYDDEPIVEEKT